jgi:hopene-associated glycosyltransferase HpnB
LNVPIMSGLAALTVLIWLYLLLARGHFWRVSHALAPAPQTLKPRRIVAVIPARDEADVIGRAVASLLAQRCVHEVHVIVVDDGSTDGTADVARAQARAELSARLTVMRGAPLTPGWTGKLWAMSQGAQRAAALDPDYLLFTDADIEHAPDNLAALVSQAEYEGWDLVSYMVRLSTATFAERALIPAFVFFFFMLYPPTWVASARSRTAAAAGGCMLVRAHTLERSGGLAAIRGSLIDDCALARLIKSSGGRVWLGLTRTARSLRPYVTFAEIGAMISRSAFHQLRHSYLLLALTLLGLLVTYVAPPLLLTASVPGGRALGACAWVLMSLAYWPMVRFYRVSPLWVVTLPLIALFYAAATVHSALQYTRGRGGRWKGRAQDVKPSA